MTYILVSVEGTLAGLLSIASLFLAENDLCMCKEGTDMDMHRVKVVK
jgi:hypothetical protein